MPLPIGAYLNAHSNKQDRGKDVHLLSLYKLVCICASFTFYAFAGGVMGVCGSGVWGRGGMGR